MSDRKISDKKYRDKNKNVLTEKRKEFAHNNKDRITEYNKKYYEENKDILNSKIECECGSTICLKHKQRHFRSKIHLAYEKGVSSVVEGGGGL
jgi:hypothetical protein